MTEYEELTSYLEELLQQGTETLALPDPSLANFWNLASNRIFYINQYIDEGILEYQKVIISINIQDKDIPISERKPIVFLINSNGGYLSESMSLAATMQMSKTPIITVNIGAAYSGASVLLLAGHKRYALPFSKAMIHTGSGELGGTHEQVQAQSEKYKREVQDMIDFILLRTGMSKSTYSKKKTKDWYIIDNEQVKHGIVDEMADNLFDVLGV